MHFIQIALVALLLSTNLGSADRRSPVVSRVHTLSIHIRNKDAYNSVYLFLRDELQLPIVYGELWRELKDGERIYSGFSAGNLVLEPCGPFPERFYTSLDFTARFYGLTFETLEPLHDGLAELDRRGITYAEPSTYTVLTDKRLCRPNLAVSVMEGKGNSNDKTSLPMLRSSLRKINGGSLGIKGVAEIVVCYVNDDDLKAWQAFLEPARTEGNDLWKLKEGPDIRLAKDHLMHVKEIVLRVESLEKGKHYLRARDLVRIANPHRVEVKPVCGINIALVE